MRILKLCLGAALVMALVAAGFANAGVNEAGTTAANFLTLGSGARILGMGGATLGLGDDVSGAAWNPAALGWTGSTQLVLSHTGLANESLQEWAALGGRFGTSQTRWAVGGLYQGDGSIEGRDASNNPTGTFSVSSFAVAAQVAHQFSGRFTLGFGLKSVTEQLGDVTGTGFTFDGGAMFKTGMLGFGAAVQNAGGQMKYPGAVYRFPANYGVGASLDHPKTGMRFALDANFPQAFSPNIRGGIEWMWKEMLALRTGYRHETDEAGEALSGPSFGLGGGKNGFWVDYGYILSSVDGGGEHRLGLKLLPGSLNMGMGALDFDDASKPKQKPVAAKPATEKTEKKDKAAAKKQEAAAKEAAAKEAAAKEPKLPPAAVAPIVAPPTPVAQAPPPSPPTSQAAIQTESKSAPAKSEKPVPAEKRPKKVSVKKGETLASIGRRYGTSAAAIMMENNLTSEVVRVGQVLKLPKR